MSESSDRRSTYADTAARQHRLRTEVLADLGVSPHEDALLVAVHYGIHLPPSELPGFATSDCYHLDGPAAESDTRAALTACLDKGLLRVIDEPALTAIAADIRVHRLLGPIYGLPPFGTVDFTPAGADLWLRIRDRCHPTADQVPFAYTDVVRERTARYFRTRSAAVAEVELLSGVDGVSVSGPTPTGPWRAHWWQWFPEGYRIDVDERHSWRGSSSEGGEECHLSRCPERADPSRLRDVLDRHNVAAAEWVVLTKVGDGPQRFGRGNFSRLAESAGREFGAGVSSDEVQGGLDAGLRYGWLRVLDRHVIDEVRARLLDDTAVLAVPRTAQLRPRGCGYILDPLRPRQLVPVPRPDDNRSGEVDFTPAGAALYRMISAEWLGPDWEDGLQVSNGYYREEHRYCETEDGLRDIVTKCVAMGQDVRSVRVTPIGPWCVYWWEQFPAGYRLAFEVGSPGDRIGFRE